MAEKSLVWLPDGSKKRYVVKEKFDERGMVGMYITHKGKVREVLVAGGWNPKEPFEFLLLDPSA